MYTNQIGKFFGHGWADFIYREIIWLFAISFSITLFNMLPLPIFDGDRVAKELINWGIGEGSFKAKKKKKEKLYFEKAEAKYGLSEYRVNEIDSVKLVVNDARMSEIKDEIILTKDKYELIDDIGDGFKDTLVLKLPEPVDIEENAYIEVSYDHFYDEKLKLKKIILNIIRGVTLTLIAANMIISIIKFGQYFFWLSWIE